MATNFVKILSRSYLGYVMFSLLFCGIFRETKRVSNAVPVSIDIVCNPRLEFVLGSVLGTPLKLSIVVYHCKNSLLASVYHIT